VASSVRIRGPSARAGLRRGALSAYRRPLLAFLLAGVAQIFLAGLGVLTLAGGRAGVGSAFSVHGALKWSMAGDALVIFVVALFARPGIRTIVLSGALFVAGPAQRTPGAPVDNATFFGGLHPPDGLLILGIAGFLYATARRRRAWMATS
jgi:hypothetical protein